jgi:hypothetical protein
MHMQYLMEVKNAETFCKLVTIVSLLIYSLDGNQSNKYERELVIGHK